MVTPFFGYPFNSSQRLPASPSRVTFNSSQLAFREPFQYEVNVDDDLEVFGSKQKRRNYGISRWWWIWWTASGDVQGDVRGLQERVRSPL